MTYSLEFLPSAKKEWDKLDAPIHTQLKKKLSERLKNPHIPSARLFGVPNRYKIKLRTVGYRLVYEVQNSRLVVLVIAVGKRDRSDVYLLANKR
jgi:mRNA interferase RelE/StbE